MVRQQILDTLIEISLRKRDEAAGVAAGARRTTLQAGKMLTQLQEYRRDYDAKSPKRTTNITGALSVERHQKFVERLDMAVVDQGHRQASAQRDQALRDAELIAMQQRLKAFETLRKRQLLAASKRQERLEQRQTDEQAARLSFWKGRS